MQTVKPEVSLDDHAFILRAKREWEQTFDAVSDLIMITDTDHTIIRVNRAMAERCGLTPKDMVGHKCFEMMHGAGVAPDYCPHAGMLVSKKPQQAEFNIEKLHGIFEVTMSPILNEEGRVTAGVHVCRDITEHRRHEELLTAQQKLLEEINRSLEDRIATAVDELRKSDDLLIQQGRLSAMGDLINSIAHHWRQPLNNIGLIVQSLGLAFKANDLSVAEMDAEIFATMEILQQISDTINDFRTFFVHEKEPVSFSVNDAVSRAVNFILPSLKNKGVKVVCHEHADICAIGFPNEYAQVILNIIINAKEALLQSGETTPLITVRVSEENGRSLVTISDNGGGIAADVLPKIFDPYFTTRVNGNGIGLYMSKMIIEKNMHGRLTACNADGYAELRVEV